MSYATTKAGFTSVLSSNSYSECENLLEFEESPLSYNHKWYVLKVEGFPTSQLTNNETIGQHLFRLEIRYANNDTTQRDTNYALFLTIAKAISNVDEFAGFETDGTFIDEDDKMHTIGTLSFYAGFETC